MMLVTVLLMLMSVTCAPHAVHLSDPNSGNGEDEGERWVVLVAGSDDWYGYADQANVCHAYQIMHANGIPDDHIIVMMYDNMAYNPKNPMPGILINEPKGENVYEGVPKDYTGEDVNPDVFLKALTGDGEGLHGIGSGKVVNSGPNDRIFLYMADHGFSGYFSFPDENLMARTLRDAIVDMHNNGRYKEILVYMDSTGSGFMFEDIYPEGIGLYATSSSDWRDSYHCCYNATMGTGLASEYGLAWMENTEWSDVNQLTLEEQYETVKVLTHKSPVHMYGDMTMGLETVSNFFGSGTANQSSVRRPSQHLQNKYDQDLIPKSNAAMEILKRKLVAAESTKEKLSLTTEIYSLQKKRDFVRETTREIALTVTRNADIAAALMQHSNRKITNWDCYEIALDTFHQHCFNLGQNTYAQTMSATWLNLCETGYITKDITNAIRGVCTFPKITGAV